MTGTTWGAVGGGDGKRQREQQREMNVEQTGENQKAENATEANAVGGETKKGTDGVNGRGSNSLNQLQAARHLAEGAPRFTLNTCVVI